jgi:hypothetical protein
MHRSALPGVVAYLHHVVARTFKGVPRSPGLIAGTGRCDRYRLPAPGEAVDVYRQK